jgi:hypothetical protein
MLDLIRCSLLIFCVSGCGGKRFEHGIGDEWARKDVDRATAAAHAHGGRIRSIYRFAAAVHETRADWNHREFITDALDSHQTEQGRYLPVLVGALTRECTSFSAQTVTFAYSVLTQYFTDPADLGLRHQAFVLIAASLGPSAEELLQGCENTSLADACAEVIALGERGERGCLVGPRPSPSCAPECRRAHLYNRPPFEIWQVEQGLMKLLPQESIKHTRSRDVTREVHQLINESLERSARAPGSILQFERDAEGVYYVVDPSLVGESDPDFTSHDTTKNPNL